MFSVLAKVVVFPHFIPFASQLPNIQYFNCLTKAVCNGSIHLRNPFCLRHMMCKNERRLNNLMLIGIPLDYL
jgi:hypothetical protein